MTMGRTHGPYRSAPNKALATALRVLWDHGEAVGLKRKRMTDELKETANNVALPIQATGILGR